MLTRKQRDLLEFIDRRVRRDGVPPSFEEMKDALDLRSKSGIHRLITALEERGFIRRLAHKARALEVIRMPDGGQAGGHVAAVIDGDRPDGRPSGAMPIAMAAIEVPVMGQIAAGTPISAIQHRTSDMAVPGAMIGQGEHYALEVKGDSMIGAGINDGDMVVIRETADADDGEIVVALVGDEEATLKRIRRHGRSIALEPANPAHETRVLPAEMVKVQGKLVGLIRTY
ncbi:MAG: transcriptional repressor LexA [Paracoccaceae bacterium]